ncbi:MAG: tol-pal system-associated acyl-CoA thioesterase [Rubrivivax sp.]
MPPDPLHDSDPTNLRNRAPVAFRHALRVYWEDTDAGGVVFYANYLKFFERARTEWLRHLGVGQQALREASGAIFVVTDTRVRHHAPARLDDLLSVTVALHSVRQASIQMQQQAWRGDVLLATGEIRIGCVDSGTFKPRRIPTDVLQLLNLPNP